ncbi:MAG: hypothetical protein MH321_03045 [Leptospiraceae bacterium]|nr:hypothetical protein [Leptospiraceae bacterium]
MKALLGKLKSMFQIKINSERMPIQLPVLSYNENKKYTESKFFYQAKLWFGFETINYKLI